MKLLRTVPGVGPRLAEAVVLCLDDPHRFKSGAEVGSYAGLVPKLIESGQMSRVGKITRRGPSLLRGMLVEVAWVVWRKNAWAQAFVTKVSRGMKSRKKIAIVALARRLLVKLWAMLDRHAVARPGRRRACGSGGERGHLTAARGAPGSRTTERTDSRPKPSRPRQHVGSSPRPQWTRM